MTASILSIGDELLIGQTLNTNAHWMAQQLNAIGISVAHVITLSDEEQDILQTLDEELTKADIVLITGGLGPTNDDLTRDVLCHYFQSELVEDEKALKNIEQIFVYRGRTFTDEVRDLAKVPVKAKVIYNTQGTAPGMLFSEQNKIVVSMPGVPYEMKAMMELDVLPYLKANLDLPVIVHEHILTAGKGESQLAEKIKHIEAALPPHIKLAYLPGIGQVKLRLSAKGNNEAKLKAEIETYKTQMLQVIGKYVYGFNQDTLEGALGELLLQKGLKIGTAESCTGGAIGAKLTSVSGSSAYFQGGVIAYSNELKIKRLNVPSATIEANGAVSESTVEAMIKGAIGQLEVDVAIAVSGIAGPTGGTEEKPVGTVVIGVGNKHNQLVKRFQFTKSRDKNVAISVVVALVMMRKFLLEAY